MGITFARLLGMAAMVAVLGAATPAVAGTSISIPEPTDLTLLAMAFGGLLYGRHKGKRPPEE